MSQQNKGGRFQVAFKVNKNHSQKVSGKVYMNEHELFIVPINYKRISVKNFKSLENVKINLSKLNVVVGPNGSGKTNLLETIMFAKLIARPAIYPPYPFSLWWGYRNLVYLHDINKNIEFKICGDVKTGENSEHFSYGFVVNGAGEKLKIIEETLDIDNSFSIKRLGNELKIHRDGNEVSGYEVLDLRYPIFNILTYPAQVYDESSGKWKLLLQINPGLAKGEPRTTTIDLDKKLIDAFGTIYANLFNDIYFLRYNPERAKAPSVPGSILGVDGFGIFSGLQNAYTGTGSKSGGYLDYFLEEFNLRMEFQYTELQTVIMKLIENGLEVEPPGIPDGYLKAITILYLLDLKPSMLVIDELENHMHLKLIEHVLSALKNSSTEVLITTHSPLIIDLVEPEELVLLYKAENSTKAKRIENAEALKKELIEKGITLSESWFYGSLSEYQ